MTGTRRSGTVVSAGLAVLDVALCCREFALDDVGGSEAKAGTVGAEGVITYDGPRPEPIPVPEAGTERRLIKVEPKTKVLKDAVVWLEGVPRPKPPGDKAPEEPVVMDQQNDFFVPHVLAVEAGREVEFRNSDVANHGVNASSLEPENRFNVVTPQGGGSRHRFVASKYPVAIGCPIHAAMAAWVYVFDHRVLRRHGRGGPVRPAAGAAGAVHAPGAAPRRRSAAAGRDRRAGG